MKSGRQLKFDQAIGAEGRLVLFATNADKPTCGSFIDCEEHIRYIRNYCHSAHFDLEASETSDSKAKEL